MWTFLDLPEANVPPLASKAADSNLQPHTIERVGGTPELSVVSYTRPTASIHLLSDRFKKALTHFPLPVQPSATAPLLRADLPILDTPLSRYEGFGTKPPKIWIK
jgi:hypothetical protein